MKKWIQRCFIYILLKRTLSRRLFSIHCVFYSSTFARTGTSCDSEYLFLPSVCLRIRCIIVWMIRTIFTERKRSCEKVKFSQVSVCLVLSRGDEYVQWGGYIQGVGMPRELVCPGDSYSLTPPIHETWDTMIGKRAVRILLECFLFWYQSVRG